MRGIVACDTWSKASGWHKMHESQALRLAFMQIQILVFHLLNSFELKSNYTGANAELEKLESRVAEIEECIALERGESEIESDACSNDWFD